MKRRDPYCPCGHPQSFHAKGHGLCRCGCEAFRLRGRGVQIEVLGCVDPGDPPYRAPLYEVRCPPCGTVYETRSHLRDIVRRRSCRACVLLRRRTKKKPTASRPADMPAAERYEHGVRARYVAGCRCEPCTVANREYARLRTKLPPNPLVAADRVRKHLLRLAQRGIGRRSVADVAKVGETLLAEVRAGRKRKLRRETAERILAVRYEDCVDDGHLVDAAPTNKLIAKLLEHGFTRTELARRLGSSARTPALQLDTDRITARNARKVARLYESFMG